MKMSQMTALILLGSAAIANANDEEDDDDE